nr:acetylcholine receptor subunit alpha-like [Misgurnus anguillicaudatus]
MYLHWVFCSLALVWLVSADEQECDLDNYTKASEAYDALFNKYELNFNNSMKKQKRPITNQFATEVLVYLLLTSITDVNEKAQSISTQVIIKFDWYTEMEWTTTNVGGIESFAAPKDLFWTPDIVVLER